MNTYIKCFVIVAAIAGQTIWANGKFNQIEKRLENIERRLEDIGNALSRLETKVMPS